MTTGQQFSRDRVRGHRNGLGLSHAEVGAAIGRTEAVVKSYEDGAAQPPAGVLAALAEMFGTTVDDLYSKRDDPVADYVNTVAAHCRPLTDAELEGAATVLRRINRRRRAAAAAASSTERPDPLTRAPDAERRRGRFVSCWHTHPRKRPPDGGSPSEERTGWVAVSRTRLGGPPGWMQPTGPV